VQHAPGKEMGESRVFATITSRDCLVRNGKITDMQFTQCNVRQFGPQLLPEIEGLISDVDNTTVFEKEIRAD
jgi:hypothetical protein